MARAGSLLRWGAALGGARALPSAPSANRAARPAPLVHLVSLERPPRPFAAAAASASAAGGAPPAPETVVAGIRAKASGGLLGREGGPGGAWTLPLFTLQRPSKSPARLLSPAAGGGAVDADGDGDRPAGRRSPHCHRGARHRESPPSLSRTFYRCSTTVGLRLERLELPDAGKSRRLPSPSPQRTERPLSLAPLQAVSSAFEGKTAVARQRAVYAAIWEELQGPVHAVDSMVCKTPAEAAK